MVEFKGGNSAKESPRPGQIPDLWSVYAWPGLKSARKYVNMAKGDKINNQITSIQLMSIYLTGLSIPAVLKIVNPHSPEVGRSLAGRWSLA